MVKETGDYSARYAAHLKAELATVRAKLAERDALLRECQSLFGDIVMGEGVDGDEAARMHKQIDALTGGDNAE